MKHQSLINITDDVNVPDPESPFLELDVPDIDISEEDFSDENVLLPLDTDFPADIDLTKDLKDNL